MILGDMFFRLISLAIDIRREELRGLLWSFFYFFTLMTTFFILRPIRDEMGIAGGVDNLPWLFTGTFLVMLFIFPIYGALVSRFPRRKFIPFVYIFFAANLIVFWYLFTNQIQIEIVARVFFVWMSVLNVFAISVFWSFMVDLFKADQSKRLFGFIAAGGTLGTIMGESITAFLVIPLGVGNLFFISALMLLIAVVCVLKLTTLEELTGDASKKSPPRIIGGGMFDGLSEILKSKYLLGIASLAIILAITATFAYFFQANFLNQNYSDGDERTQIFALVGLVVSILTIFTQVFIVNRVMAKFGVKGAIILLPIITVIGFTAIAIMPTIIVFFVFQIFRRTGEYALLNPARENLFSILPREEKYKAKNFIDTVAYRGADAGSGWVFAGLSSGLGLSFKMIAMIGVPIAAIWSILAWRLGKHHQLKLNELGKNKND